MKTRFLGIALIISSFFALSASAYYGPRWVCYSRYAGAVGWGSYYGYALNQWMAANNALTVCQMNHNYDPYACIVTGCVIR